MISRLTGILAAKRAPQILIDCNGVGYEADVSMTTYYQLPEIGEQISIWTHLLVKEDSHSLIGFTGERERKLFRQLIRINADWGTAIDPQTLKQAIIDHHPIVIAAVHAETSTGVLTPLNEIIEGRLVGIGTGLSIAEQPCVNDARIERCDPLVAEGEAVPANHTAAVPLDERHVLRPLSVAEVAEDVGHGDVVGIGAGLAHGKE